MLAAPVILYEFWMFIAPGLYQKEKKLMLPIVFLSTIFFLGGSLFGYFFVFPWGFKFFLGFASDNIQALPSMREYLGFSAKLLLAFGLCFELPLVLTFLAKLNIITVEFLKKNRKYAPIMTVSALTGLRVTKIFKQVDKVYDQYIRRVGTGQVNKMLNEAVERNRPPFYGRGRLKFLYATQVSTKPPTFVCFINTHQAYFQKTKGSEKEVANIIKLKRSRF